MTTTRTAGTVTGTMPSTAPAVVPSAPRRARRALRWVLAVVVLLAALLAGALVGPAGLTPASVLAELANALPGVDIDSGLTTQQQAILWQIRLPRVILGSIVGATYALGATVGGGRTSTVIILAGVAVAAFFSAIQTFVQQRFDDSLLAVYTWILGRLSTNGWSDIVTIAPYVVLSWVVLLLHRRVLDVLALGDVEAASLGINVPRVRLVLVLTATLGTTAVVSVSGLIGFVGIVVPHAMRLIFGSSYRLLLPLSMLLGAAFLVLTDVAARSLIAPAELPIGVVTALLGAPFFLVVLRRGRAIS